MRTAPGVFALGQGGGGSPAADAPRCAADVLAAGATVVRWGRVGHWPGAFRPAMKKARHLAGLLASLGALA